MSACTASIGGVQAHRALRAHYRSARVARATTVTVTAKATSPHGNIVEDVASEKKRQEQRHPFFATLRRSTAAAAAAAVVIATGPDAALANVTERGVPPPPTNGPLKNLPRGAYV